MCKSCAAGGKPLAAIWSRVSTYDQREMSLDSQESAVQARLIAMGYEVPGDYVLKVNWTSLDLMACQDFQQLRRWMANGDIHAIGVSDRDRLQAQGLQRLIFLSECQERAVQIITVQGPPLLDGAEGQLVELALALGKEKSVLRSQQGAKDGLRDRAKLRGLPATGTPPYGYRFRYEERGGKEVPVALEPHPDTYHIAADIWRLALEKYSIRGIGVQLASDDVPAPKGGPVWNPSTIARILNNPAYGGRFFALRQEAKSPDKRRKPDSYGKSSSRILPRESWQELPDFPIISPIVTWEEWETVQQRLVQNRQQSRRNGKRFYLLRGTLTCPNHPRRLTGHARGDRFWYECPIRRGHDMGVGSKCPRVAGAKADSLVWQRVSAFLSDPEMFLAELESQRESSGDLRSDSKKKIAAAERELAEVTRQESELVNLRLRGVVSLEALDRSAALLRAKRTHYLDEIEREKAALATAEQVQAAVESLAALRDRIADRLDSATPEDRRRVLEVLDTRITVTETGGLDISIGVPFRADYVHQTQGQ